jgi:hypothetical protein
VIAQLAHKVLGVLDALREDHEAHRLLALRVVAYPIEERV